MLLKKPTRIRQSKQPFNKTVKRRTKSQAKTPDIGDFLVWFSTTVFQDPIFPLLLVLPDHVFPNRYLT